MTKMTYKKAFKIVGLHLDNNGEIKRFALWRRLLSDQKKPNPVTRVTERLAEPEVVEDFLFAPISQAGHNLLADIHAELDAVEQTTLLRKMAADPTDTITRIHLTICALRNFEDEEVRRLERVKLDNL